MFFLRIPLRISSSLFLGHFFISASYLLETELASSKNLVLGVEILYFIYFFSFFLLVEDLTYCPRYANLISISN